MNSEVATYTEVTARGRRHYALHADRVVVAVAWGGLQAETIVKLNGLRPEPDKLWYRDPTFRKGIPWLVASGGMTALSLAIPFPEKIQRWVMAIGIGFLVGGLRICVKFRARIEYARFPSSDGVVRLDVGRSGPDQHRFDEFIQMLSEQIREAHAD